MWGWLQDKGYSWGVIGRVLLKALILFGLCNLIYALAYPVTGLGQLSIYGVAAPHRVRLPYGENPAQSYNLSVGNLHAMFSATDISRRKAPDEFRVLLVGDSATWGWFLQPDETYAAQINAAGAALPDGRRVVAYNIGYPVLSVTKDLVLLNYARRYDPDLVVWLVTAQSMRYTDENGASVQAAAPVTEWNDPFAQTLVPRPATPWSDRTLVGDRRSLADLLRLQVYSVAWAATGIDHFIPPDYDLRRTDLSDSVAWGGFDRPTNITRDDLAFDIIETGIFVMQSPEPQPIPVILVNQPIFISDGDNSDLRYNSFYPRWAYDQYRDLLAGLATENGWTYADWWDMLPPQQFTDTPVHVTPDAAGTIAQRLLDLILEEVSLDGPSNRES